ncbi:MAG: glycosyltransferase family 2 protein [Candidatus Omnitrophota bacterium]
MKISLYIPCFNAESYIEDTLKGVFSQTLKPDEVVIVDDNSSDRTVEKVSPYPIKLIRHKHNRGLAVARNTAVKNIDSKYIASLDADCAPEPGWLETLMKRFTSSDIAGTGGKLLEKNLSTTFDLWRAVHMKQYWAEGESAPPFLFGSNTVFRRQALTEVGVYSENFRDNYEDVDICERLKKKGYSLVYEPKATVKHLKRDNVCSVLNNYWKWNLAFHQKKGCYSSPKGFSRKLRENVGLANRYIHEDIISNQHQLLYLDFLLGLHNSLKDLEYFTYQKIQKPNYSISSFWFSLIDLSLFYRFSLEKKEIVTLMPKANMFLQNFFALNLVLGKIIREKFVSRKFKKILYRHLLFSVYSITDNIFLDKLLDLTESRYDWSRFYKVNHSNLNNIFLRKLSFDFKKWLNSLAFDHPEAIRMIQSSAENMGE